MEQEKMQNGLLDENVEEKVPALAEDKLQQVTGGFDSPTINEETKEKEQEPVKRRPRLPQVLVE